MGERLRAGASRSRLSPGSRVWVSGPLPLFGTLFGQPAKKTMLASATAAPANRHLIMSWSLPPTWFGAILEGSWNRRGDFGGLARPSSAWRSARAAAATMAL